MTGLLANRKDADEVSPQIRNENVETCWVEVSPMGMRGILSGGVGTGAIHVKVECLDAVKEPVSGVNRVGGDSRAGTGM